MSVAAAGWLQAGLLVFALAVTYRPLGDYMAHILTSAKHWRVEKGLYKLMGVDSEADQTWPVYIRSVLAISVVGILLLYLILRVQDHLMLSLGMPQMQADLAYNTASSFVTNTNWQNYVGESTLGYTAQFAGLAVQNFVSVAVGICVVATLIRGFVRTRTDRVGNFWVDLTRLNLRLLLPFSIVFGIILIATGVPQELSSHLTTVNTLTGGSGSVSTPARPASQEAIKEARHQRRRRLQRQLRASVREPERVHELAGDLPAAAASGSRCRARSARWSARTSRATSSCP